jgi:glycosyltransferase involved in cell wall biosynthesis
MGGQNRYFHLVQELVKHGNHVIVLEPQVFFDHADLAVAKVYTYPSYQVFHRGLSFSKDLDIWFTTKLIQILENEQVDIIAIEYPSGALAVKLALLLTKSNASFIYSSQNVESNFARDVLSQVTKFSLLERKVLTQYVTVVEKLATRYFVDHITAVSQADKDLFCSKYGIEKEKVTVIPSGCELRNPVDEEAKERLRAKMGFDPDCTIVVFHGSYDHPPNREAIDRITNCIAPMLEPDESIVLALYGSGVPRFNRANVRSFGFVEDLHEALSIADIALVPLTHGGGTRLKIFDYMNAGLPIVTTQKGVEGIRVNGNEHVILVEDVNNEIVSAIEYLAQNTQERERLGLNARRLLENEYTWDLIGDKLDDTYRKLRVKGPKDVQQA